uniref:Transposase n=1 Tax=Steinernema glaseri TaxID=37863 RepID=A0A1I7Y2M6_9BILA
MTTPRDCNAVSDSILELIREIKELCGPLRIMLGDKLVAHYNRESIRLTKEREKWLAL